MGGAFQSAVVQDDDLAQIIYAGESVDSVGQKRLTKPPSYGWDNTRTDLADLKDLLLVLIRVTARSEEPVTLHQRPETARDRWERAKRKESTDWINEQLGLTEKQR